MILIGVDIGGTFTDFVSYEPIIGDIQTFKLLSTAMIHRGSDPGD
jgi:N-methylhydantoinase A/oxoprolinase/acetone carboxylase beta subunit